MSIRKIRKAGQQKVFMSCTKYSSGLHMFTKQYGSKRFKRVKLKSVKGLDYQFDQMKRKKAPFHKHLGDASCQPIK